MFSFLDPRLWGAVLLSLALSFAGGYFYGHHQGAKHVQLEWDAAVSRANSEARHLEQERQRRADDAARIAAAREMGIRADAVRARSELDGLRGDLDAIERISAQSLSTSHETIRVTSRLLADCANRYLGVSEAAARADAEARELRQAWPK